MSKNNTITLTLAEICELANYGIAGLSGFTKFDAKGNAHIVPYSFTDEVRQRITQNRRVLRPYIEETDNDLRKAITVEITGDPTAEFIAEEDKTKLSQWRARYLKASTTTHEVAGLHVFNRSDLFRENRNPIPSEVEDALGPVIKDSPWQLAQKAKQPPAPAPAPEPEGGDAAPTEAEAP